MSAAIGAVWPFSDIAAAAMVVAAKASVVRCGC